MRSLRLGGLELRRFTRSRLTRAALAGVVTLPLLYAGLYLWSFWDPQGNLGNIPVALVVEDRPATAGGRTVDAGRELARELRERHVFDWHTVDARQAEDGVNDGGFYLSLTVPADFSARLVSPSGDGAPRPAELGVRVDTGRSYVMRTISDAVFAEVRGAAGRTALKDYWDEVFVSFGELHDATAKAADGADELHDGTEKAGEGASTLSSGLGQAKSGTHRLAVGLGSANTATGRLSSGADSLADGLGEAGRGSRELARGLVRLADGAKRVAEGNARVHKQVHAQVSTIDEVADQVVPVLRDDGARLRSLARAIEEGADRLTESTGRLGEPAAPVGETDALARLRQSARQISEIAARSAEIAPTAGQRLQQVRKKIDQLDAGLGELADGSAKVRDGLGDASTAGGRLTSGLSRLGDGAAELSRGLTELDGGIVRLSDGAAKVDTGVGRLREGAGELSTGIGRLADGSRELSDKLGQGATRIPDYGRQERAERSDMMSEPVRLATQVLNPVPNYGTGFAPFFVPLALWVGAMVSYMVLRPLNPRLLAGTAPAWRIALAGWLPGLVLGTAQVGVLLAVTRFGLGMEAEHWAGVVGLLSLTAAAFLAIVQAVNALLGPPGRVAVLALLMLQLTSAAGTYPIETSPGFFRTISPWLPMSWVVSALRRLISGGDLTVVWQACGVLALFTALGLALSVYAVCRGRTWSMRRLHPELAL
ncbi:YhgE/Pip domain-containing protein [Streptosporangium carneum]|uniref:Membrane protein n=1 Tax=Streptosporangium carneum TaxID=47481 RepID=A0A9W6MBM2_9ACTN|nr:YhgE/Pip domain-containing protein [Streptosporangium carneum]GLK08276.1 membrane protein [Streptosporangium carneum]